MSHAGDARPIVRGAPDPDTLAKVLTAAEPVLGRDHPLCHLLIHAMADTDSVAVAWAAIEALPAEQRRLLAAGLGEVMLGTDGAP